MDADANLGPLNDAHLLSQGNCSLAVLPYGSLFYSDTELRLRAPALLFGNCSDPAAAARAAHTILASHALLGTLDRNYGSVTTVAFALCAATVASWMLFLLLVIAKQRRPLLMWLACLGVAVDLSVILGKMVEAIRFQYEHGYLNVAELQHNVNGSLYYRILEVVAGLFVWLAQIQVVLRLVSTPVAQRWVITYFGLMATTNILFWCFDHFYSPNSAWNVLACITQIGFQVSYVAAIVAYSISKWRFAYATRAVPLAVLTLVVIVLPFVFFLFSITEQWLNVWADYFRWVSEASASVVAWEWINVTLKIEAEFHRHSVLGKPLKSGGEFRGAAGGGAGGGGVVPFTGTGGGAAALRSAIHSGCKTVKDKSHISDLGNWVAQRLPQSGAVHIVHRNRESPAVELADLSPEPQSPVPQYSHSTLQASVDGINEAQPSPRGLPTPPAAALFGPAAEEDETIPVFTHKASTLDIDALSRSGQRGHPNTGSGRVAQHRGRSNPNVSVVAEPPVVSAADLADSQEDLLLYGPPRQSQTVSVPATASEAVPEAASASVTAANVGIVTESAQSPVETPTDRVDSEGNPEEQPPMFERIPGYNDGDYWDEKA